MGFFHDFLLGLLASSLSRRDSNSTPCPIFPATEGRLRLDSDRLSPSIESQNTLFADGTTSDVRYRPKSGHIWVVTGQNGFQILELTNGAKGIPRKRLTTYVIDCLPNYFYLTCVSSFDQRGLSLSPEIGPTKPHYCSFSSLSSDSDIFIFLKG